MNQYDMIIVGAGISGMSLAYYSARSGLKTLVLEKNERTGGCFSSHRLEDGSGFWLEMGAHTCYNSYASLLGIIEECGILGRITKREKVSYKMLVDNRITSIPSQINFAELFFAARHLFFLKKAGQSVESYYTKIVGRNNFGKVFGPAFNAVISQRANDFPADMLFKKRPRRKDIMKSFAVDGGLLTIIDAISARPNITVMVGKDVRSMRYEDGLFVVATADGSRYGSRNFALAVPPPAAAALLQQSFQELSLKLSQVRTESLETMGVVLKRDALALGPLAGIIAAGDSFYSAVSRDVVQHERYRGFSFHFKPGRTDRNAKLKRITEVLEVSGRHMEYVGTRDNIVPSLTVGHERLVKDIDILLGGKRLLLTGNYFSGMAIEDCVARSLSEFLRLASFASSV
ncbi:MAG TPA: FAD-dependent oxidoreductase [Thermodesulfovibrionales bacterium]|nr:FAD-dependent oxidoreductase [Thermodesulfovibrionales bacterium]